MKYQGQLPQQGGRETLVYRIMASETENPGDPSTGAIETESTLEGCARTPV